MSDVANSATVTFNAVAVAKIQDISLPESATEIDCDSIGDTEKIRQLGLVDKPVEITVWGIPAIAIDAIGALVITWNDALSTVDSFTDYRLASKQRSGAKDANIQTTLRFVKSAS